MGFRSPHGTPMGGASSTSRSGAATTISPMHAGSSGRIETRGSGRDGSVVEAGTVRRLLEVIEQRLGRLQEVASVPLAQYLGDRDRQDIAERNLEIAIQACLDLGLHVLGDFPAPLPET